MSNEIDEGQPPLEDSKVQTKHFSSVLLVGTSGRYVIEIIPIRPNGELNHRAVKRFIPNVEYLAMAKLAQSHTLLALETSISTGKTAKQALIDAMKPTHEEEEQMTRDFEAFLRSLRD